jgi:hypothetical protein
MTKTERAEWKAKVKTDADAEQFIKDFLAKRPATFAGDVAANAAAADKHLTVAGKAGSATLRGKLVILLGPPSSFTTKSHEVHGDLSGSANMAIGAGKSGGGASVGDMMDARNRQVGNRTVFDYVFTYPAAKLPVSRPKDLVVTVLVEGADGSDSIPDRKAAAELDDIFEAVAQSRLSK